MPAPLLPAPLMVMLRRRKRDTNDLDDAPLGFEQVPTEADGDRPRRSRLRRAARVAGFGTGALVTLVVLAVGFLHTGWGKDVVRAQVEKALAARVTGSASVGELDYSFLLGDLQVKGVTIRDAAGRDTIGLEALEIDLDRGSFLRRAPRIERLAIGGLAVSVIENPDGTNNLTGLLAPSDAPAGQPPVDSIEIAALELDRISARIAKADGTSISVEKFGLRGSAVIDVKQRSTEIAFDNFDAELRRVLPGGEELRAPLRIAELALGRGDGDVDVSLRDVVAGPLSIDAITAHIATAPSESRGTPALVGAQRFSLAGLKVDREWAIEIFGDAARVLPADLLADLSIRGPSKALEVEGSLRVADSELSLAGELDLSDFGDPRYRLELEGSALDSTMVAPDATAARGDIALSLRGHGRDRGTADAELSISVPRLKVGDIDIDTLETRARIEDGHIALSHLHAEAAGLAVVASGSVDPDRNASLEVRASGQPTRIRRALSSLGIEVPQLAALRGVELELGVEGALDGALAVDVRRAELKLASGTVRTTGTASLVAGDAGHQLGSASIDVKLAGIEVAPLLAALGAEAPAVGARIDGSLHIDKASPAAARFAIDARLDGTPVDLRATGSASQRRVSAELIATRRGDGSTLAVVDLGAGLLPGAAMPVDPRAPLRARISIPRRSVSEVLALVPAELRAEIGPLPPATRGAAVELELELAGSVSQPRGTLVASLETRAVDGAPPQTVSLRGSVRPEDGGLGLDGAVELALGKIHLGTLGAAGRIDHPLRVETPGVDLRLDLQERPVAELLKALSTLPGKGGLAKLAGTLDGRAGGTVIIRGTTAAPSIASELAWRGYRTASGTTGELRLSARGGRQGGEAVITVGKGDLRIAADIAPTTSGMKIDARALADDTAIAALLPAGLATDALESAGAHAGRLDWDMTVAAEIERGAAGMKLAKLLARGELEIAGARVKMPGSDRQITDIGARIEAGPGTIRLASLRADERDPSGHTRTIRGSGAVTLAGLAPRAAELELRARRWLVADGAKLGTADAPRAEVDFDIGVRADLAGAIPQITATVRSLELSAPERYARHHQPLDIAPAGDVIFLEPGHEAGVLRRPEPTPAASQSAGGPPMDITVLVPEPLRLHSAPLDVRATGRIDVRIREDGRSIAGKLEMLEGSLDVFGHPHQLRRGAMVFDDEHPGGRIELELSRELPPAIARGLASEAARDGLVMKLSGGLDEPSIELGGAAHSLLDFMAMHNAGRGTGQVGLDVPSSQSVQAPRGDQPMVLTFLASNLPHLLFLDRFSAWSDPYRSGYGRVESFEGEVYSDDQDRRVRVVSRPRQQGRSRAEVQVDRLFVNDERMAAGVGVRAGSRLGGGVGVFVEWSSED